MDRERDAIEDIRAALALDDIPLVHLDHGRLVPDAKHPWRISPLWLVPVAILSLSIGLMIGRFL